MTMILLEGKSFETSDEKIRIHMAFAVYHLKIPLANFCGILTDGNIILL